MAQYGEVRVDYITYTTGTVPTEANATVTVSSLVNNPSFSGDINVEGNAIIEGNLNVSGDSLFESITVSNNSILNNLTVTGGSNLEDVEISGTLTVTGNSNLNDVEIGGTLTVTGDAFISGDLTVGGNLNADGVTISGFTGLFASGSKSAPSISFIDDEDTGIYNRRPNELAFSTSGSAAAKFDSRGVLKIGNTVDSYEEKTFLSGVPLLVVDKTMPSGIVDRESELMATFGYAQAGQDTRQITLFAPGKGGSGSDPRAKIKNINTNYPLAIELGNNANEKEVLRMLSDGRVGINQIGPRKKVEIQGDDSNTISGAGVLITSSGTGLQTYSPDGPGLFLTAQGMNTNQKYTPILAFGSTDQDFTSNNPRTGASIVGVAAETFSTNDRGAMHMAFFTRPINAGSSQVQTEAMIIRQDQKVGIGISNPSTRLEVQMSGQIDPAVVSATSPKGTINATLSSGTRGLDEIGPGYSFGGINTSRRKALITSTQTTANDTYGLSFYTALNNDITSDSVVEHVRIDHQGYTGFNITNPEDIVHTPSATIPSGLSLSALQQDRKYGCCFSPQGYVSGEQILVLATIVFAGNSENITLNGTCGSNAGTIHGTSEFNIQLRNNNAGTPVIVIGTQEYKHENIRPSIKAYKNITSGNTNEFVLAMSADINNRNTIHMYYADFTAQLRDAAYQPYITMPDSVIDLTPNLANYQETIIPVNTTAIVTTNNPSSSGSVGLYRYGIDQINPQSKLHVGSGHIRVDSGFGIHFADYGSGVTVNNNILDDYEEGTWTPIIADADSGGNTVPDNQYTKFGAYTKVGNTVIAKFRIANANLSTLTSGNALRIRGLPFTPTNDNLNNIAAVQTSSVDFSGADNLVAKLAIVTNTITLMGQRSNALDTALLVSDFGSSSQMRCTMIYPTTA